MAADMSQTNMRGNRMINSSPLERHYFPFNGVLLLPEKFGATFGINLSIGEGLTADAGFDCFGFFASRLLLF